MLGVVTVLLPGCGGGSDGDENNNGNAQAVQSVQITPSTLTLSKGTTQALTALATLEDGSQQAITRQAMWHSDNPKVVTVDDNGMLTAVGEGDTSVRVTYQGKRCDAIVTVTPARLVAIQLTMSSLQVPQGLAKPLMIIGEYSDHSLRTLNDSVTVSVADRDIALVDNLMLRGVAEGRTALTITQNDAGKPFRTVFEVNVTAPLTLTDITITPQPIAMGKGETKKVNAIGHFTNGEQHPLLFDVNWSVTDYSVAMVRHEVGQGTLVGQQDGQTTLTASAQGISSDAVPVTVNSMKIASTLTAFAALKPNGQVITWGNGYYGGYSEHLEHAFNHVQSITANNFAFAAINIDNTLVSWGSFLDVLPPQYATEVIAHPEGWAFAAFQPDGSVKTWGHALYGGDSSYVDLNGITAITPAGWAFAGLKHDGSVVAWGHPEQGGRIASAIGGTLSDVKAIFATSWAFAALKNDGSVVTWGNPTDGGNSAAVQPQLNNVKTIFSTNSAFAALKQDSSVVVWGTTDPLAGTGNPPTSQVLMPAGLKDVKTIFTANDAFAALKNDGTVVTWGDKETGGDSSYVQSELRNVVNIYNTGTAFAAVRADGTVVTWGLSSAGGNSSIVHAELHDVTAIYSTLRAFAALRSDGSVVTWGMQEDGGDITHIEAQLKNVIAIYSTWSAFAAVTADNKVVTWGNQDEGGNSTGIEW